MAHEQYKLKWPIFFDKNKIIIFIEGFCQKYTSEF